MTDDDFDALPREHNKLAVIKADRIERHRWNQSELEAEITKIVDEVLESDIRLESTPEVREALRDYVRIEILFSMKIKNAILNEGDVTTADERMIRSAAKIKHDLRMEIWQEVRAEPGKDRVINVTRELIEKKVIKAKKKVDPLE